MYRMLIGTAALAASLAFAQQTSAQKDRSTAKTAGESNRAMITANDKKFAMEAAEGGMAEVKLGQLAAEKATDPEVKQFGERMVKDHSKANDQLKSIAAAQKIDLPTSLDARHQATVDRLSKLSGAEFDHAYVKEMVRDHDTDVKSFQREAQYGQESSLRDFAAKTLPTLQDHQKQIHDIDRKMSGKPTSANRYR
jgi:putative membrane protein